MTLFIEILDDANLRVCTQESITRLRDAELPAYLKQAGKADIVLLDPLHVQSKTFQRPVKDKKVLSQVIAADMADYLLHDKDSYQFAHHNHRGVMWVSWIEKSRLALIKKRFAAILPRIKALVSAPLLAAQSLPDANDTGDEVLLFEHEPLVYALRSGQTTVLRSEHAAAWLQSQHAEHQSVIVSTPTQRQHIFAPNAHRGLPNLWHKTNDKPTATLPYGAWALLTAGIMALWLANSYIDWQRAQQHNAAALSAQQQLLRQIFPQANSADPYGRLAAEHRRLGSKGNTDISQLERLLQSVPLTVSHLTVDATARQVTLGGKLDSNTQQSLQDAGFSISHHKMETIITWQP